MIHRIRQGECMAAAAARSNFPHVIEYEHVAYIIIYVYSRGFYCAWHEYIMCQYNGGILSTKASSEICQHLIGSTVHPLLAMKNYTGWRLEILGVLRSTALFRGWLDRWQSYTRLTKENPIGLLWFDKICFLLYFLLLYTSADWGAPASTCRCTFRMPSLPLNKGGLRRLPNDMTWNHKHDNTRLSWISKQNSPIQLNESESRSVRIETVINHSDPHIDWINKFI